MKTVVPHDWRDNLDWQKENIEFIPIYKSFFPHSYEWFVKEMNYLSITGNPKSDPKCLCYFINDESLEPFFKFCMNALFNKDNPIDGEIKSIINLDTSFKYVIDKQPVDASVEGNINFLKDIYDEFICGDDGVYVYSLKIVQQAKRISHFKLERGGVHELFYRLDYYKNEGKEISFKQFLYLIIYALPVAGGLLISNQGNKIISVINEKHDLICKNYEDYNKDCDFNPYSMLTIRLYQRALHAFNGL